MICEALLAALSGTSPATSPSEANISHGVALGGRALAVKVEEEAVAI
jgi:hypothetical protein